MTSESVVERKRMPLVLERRRAARCVFTRLPLCASAMTWRPIAERCGCAFSQLVDEPVVE